MAYVSAVVWVLSPAALVVLWRRRPHSVLDVWLMVVLCAWLFDVALSAVLNAHRFDLGFYAGRIYGFLAAAFVLMMMQIETAKMYARLARLLTSEQQVRRREAEQRRRIFDTSLDLILVVDRGGKLLQVSPSAMSILGYEPEEMLGRSAAEFVYAADLDNTRRQMRMARRGGVIRNFECRYVGKAGLPVPLVWMGVWSEAAQEHFFIGRDMTDQKAIDGALKQALSRQQAIFNSAMIGIITLNESGSIETLNPSAERMFGVTSAEVARRDIGRLIDLGGPNDVSSGGAASPHGRRRRRCARARGPSRRQDDVPDQFRDRRHADRRAPHVRGVRARHHHAQAPRAHEGRVRRDRQPRAAHADDLDRGLARPARGRRRGPVAGPGQAAPRHRAQQQPAAGAADQRHPGYREDRDPARWCSPCSRSSSRR